MVTVRIPTVPKVGPAMVFVTKHATMRFAITTAAIVTRASVQMMLTGLIATAMAVSGTTKIPSLVVSRLRTGPMRTGLMPRRRVAHVVEAWDQNLSPKNALKAALWNGLRMVGVMSRAG